jgi:hypothetical protein
MTDNIPLIALLGRNTSTREVSYETKRVTTSVTLVRNDASSRF